MSSSSLAHKTLMSKCLHYGGPQEPNLIYIYTLLAQECGSFPAQRQNKSGGSLDKKLDLSLLSVGMQGNYQPGEVTLKMAMIQQTSCRIAGPVFLVSTLFMEL